MAEALARAALAGNPSDGYGGAVLAVTIPAFRAEVELVHAGDVCGGAPMELIEATLVRFESDYNLRAAVARWQTSIPRSVGLGGSSAIVIATLRALCELHGVHLAPDVMAELALSIERDDLGIAAGLQDRIAQCYGGLTFMEFAEPHAHERLHPELLPPLLVAWRAHAAAESGVVHNDLRTRFDSGDTAVRGAMVELASLARGAREALMNGDHARLSRCADGSFDVRQRIMELDPRHVEMVRVARAAGAGVNYTGSGGAVVCVCEHAAHRRSVADALHAADCETVDL
jgi:glucuronokinase